MMIAPKLGIDLGTANTVIVTSGKGIVLDEPSVVAFAKVKGKRTFLAVGDNAKLMLGKTPESIYASQPLNEGVIADFDDAEEMIKHFFKKASPATKFFKPEVVVCVPFGATPVEKRAIQQALKSAGARRVGLLAEPMAAALGAKLPVLDPTGSMIVDIGGGTTEIALIALGGIVIARSIKVGGRHFDLNLINSVKKNLELHIGHMTAEHIKIEIGCARVPDGSAKSEPMMISGVGSLDGLPKAVSTTQKDYCEAVKPLIDSIEINIREVLEKAPPDLAADIYDSGITIAGGGSLLDGLDSDLTDRLGINVCTAENPKYCVAHGSAHALTLGKKISHAIEYEV